MSNTEKTSPVVTMLIAVEQGRQHAAAGRTDPPRAGESSLEAALERLAWASSRTPDSAASADFITLLARLTRALNERELVVQFLRDKAERLMNETAAAHDRDDAAGAAELLAVYDGIASVANAIGRGEHMEARRG